MSPTTTPRESTIDMDRIAMLLRTEHGFDPDHTYVEQTGGGCATLYVGRLYTDFSWGWRRAALAGPGWFESNDATADGYPMLAFGQVGDFTVGADDEGATPPWFSVEEPTEEAEIAALIAARIAERTERAVQAATAIVRNLELTDGVAAFLADPGAEITVHAEANDLDDAESFHAIHLIRAAVEAKRLTAEQREYVRRVRDLLLTRPSDVPTRQLASVCPECGRNTADLNIDPEDLLAHVTADSTIRDTPAVVIGCEGYWVIDPGLVGLTNTHWHGPDALNGHGGDSGDELDIDEVEAIGLDGTGRDGDPRFPYTWAKLTDAERAALWVRRNNLAAHLTSATRGQQ
jgi:hypothetical protein